MAKREYRYRAGAVFARSGQVVLSAWIDDSGPHHDRPLQSAMSPADARMYAAQLVEAADKAEGVTLETRERDETPTVCAACDRTRPRWTMNHVGGGAWVCAPTFRMHCGVCCQPGEYLTHYTEEEHRHGDDMLDHADAERMARLEASLGDTDSEALPDAQGRYCSRCHQDHTPEECYYKV